MFNSFFTKNDISSSLIHDISQIYKSCFNTTEIQKIILSHSSDLLPYCTLIYEHENIQKFTKYLEETFKGNEKDLKDFLLRKIESTNQNIFELSLYGYFEDEKLKLFSELLDNLNNG